jgi:hypothetical protein
VEVILLCLFSFLDYEMNPAKVMKGRLKKHTTAGVWPMNCGWE